MFRRLPMGPIVWVFVLLGSTGLGANADSESDGVVEASLDEALRAFADRSGLQLVYPAELAEGKTANHAGAAARDAKTREQELDLLLAGSGLGYRFVNAHTVALVVAVDRSDDEDSAGDAANTDEATASGDEDANADDDADIETVVVTGTRLPTGDPSARVAILTREDVKALGVATTEEVIRSIPHNFSTVNGFNNLDTTDIDIWLGRLALGISTVNLRGFGSVNTLVLVNGKRVAGAAGYEGLFTNIRHIPASAIERVEVHLDGGPRYTALTGSAASSTSSSARTTRACK